MFVNIMFCFHRCYDVNCIINSVICPLCTDVMVVRHYAPYCTDVTVQNHYLFTTWSSESILKLLEFCLVNTYFLFNGQFFEQTKGAAMGSPVSSIVANIYMEAFEDRALSTALHPPNIWKRYVDDTFVIQLESQRDEFLPSHQPSGHIHQVHHQRSWTKWFHPFFRSAHNT